MFGSLAVEQLNLVTDQWTGTQCQYMLYISWWVELRCVFSLYCCDIKSSSAFPTSDRIWKQLWHQQRLRPHQQPRHLPAWLTHDLPLKAASLHFKSPRADESEQLLFSELKKRSSRKLDSGVTSSGKTSRSCSSDDQWGAAASVLTVYTQRRIISSGDWAEILVRIILSSDTAHKPALFSVKEQLLHESCLAFRKSCLCLFSL